MDEIRDAASSLQKLLAALEAQESEDQSPVCVKAAKLKARVLELEQKLKNVVDEKEYWLRRCVEYEASFATMVRRTRSNSELREMADTFVNPPSKGQSPRSKHASTLVEDLTNAPSIPSMIKAKRASFRLLQCSDEECEVFTSLNRTIQTQCRAKNNVQLMWDTSPTAVLLVKKPNEPNVSRTMREVAAWLMHDKHMRVFLEPKVHDEEGLAGTVTWTDSQDWLTKQHEIDLVVSFGGDGTVLWVSSLFKTNVPPVFSFAMGSLGFLTPFDVSRYEEHLTQLIRGGFHMSLRQRLICTIIRADNTPHVESVAMPIHALNEVVIDRGQSAALVELDCFCDDVALTKISADGIIIATPTGSTAYSLSAGGSMTHPSVPCMLFTPICPHTLSFRPLLFHDSAHLKIVVPTTARTSSVMTSFDGKVRVEMKSGDTLHVRVSTFPLPSVCNLNENEDWFASVKSNLNWNQRKEMKPFFPNAAPTSSSSSVDGLE
ncbi:hypothetical protein H310_05052 [Aphanomyces invadans]|uniref:NAD kinase n=1 Tax=Aphanomyces invadans TaxID=157072 RepID=A0A024UB55_9STRA|nr:hypothetical protein H310_05052 [Aphanomyces invadans]ETW03656.1 hypothetical protein H310_05052 [Aphanomyces invadans]|eukprot:XP_008867885.1 hypothetical protein H310_05052 [Aphanomyces invadans]